MRRLSRRLRTTSFTNVRTGRRTEIICELIDNTYFFTAMLLLNMITNMESTMSQDIYNYHVSCKIAFSKLRFYDINKFLLQKHIWEEMDIQHMFLIEIILPEDQPIFYNWICSWCKLQFRNLLNTRVLQENLMLLYTKKLWFPELAPTEHVIKQWHLKQPTVKKSQLEKFVNIVQRIVYPFWFLPFKILMHPSHQDLGIAPV